jgi:hypothetical protein
MKAILARTYEKNQTIGSIIIFEGRVKKYQCVSIELPDLGNQHDISCIPEGAYDVVKEDNPKRGMVFRVLNVPGRDGILIHKGNYASGNHVDTLGCILPGKFFEDLNQDGNLDVGDSTGAMKDLIEILPNKFKLYII